MQEGKATHSSIIAWRIPIDRGAWQATNSPGRHKESDMTDLWTQHNATLETHMSHMEGLMYFIEMFSFQIFK